MSAVLLSLATFAATSAGGICALCLRDRLPVVLGFAGGALLGVACFHLMPESFALSRALGGNGQATLLAVAGGLLLFHGLQRLVLARGVPGVGRARHPHVGLLSSAALVGHSFLDGAGIGLALQVSQAAGLAVAVAVIAHDFCDGMNTVGVMLAHRNSVGRALAMLMLDAIAPVLGAASTLAFRLPPEALVLYLGFFAGLLLYIGSAALLPLARAHAGSAALRSIAPTGLGILLVYALTRLVR